MKYVIGDKVLIEVYVVNTDKKDERLPYEIEVYGERYWVEESDLKGSFSDSTTNQSATMSDIVVGDIVELKDELRTKVHSVATDYFYSEEYGEDFNISDVVAIYKKSWEKSKELEEMSKEELIDLVKKLKGE